LQSALSGDEEIREMKEGDIEEILRIERNSFAAPWTRRSFEETISSPLSRSFVLTKSGLLIGYILLYIIHDEGHILNIALDPECRRRGHGSKLVALALGRAQAWGATEFFLEVREQNKGAISLYRAFGFEVIGRRKRYYPETNEDALVMKLSTSMTGDSFRETHG
jgi:ribosomal-protein-alanine N-acetyltransferase